MDERTTAFGTNVHEQVLEYIDNMEKVGDLFLKTMKVILHGRSFFEQLWWMSVSFPLSR